MLRWLKELFLRQTAQHHDAAPSDEPVTQERNERMAKLRADFETVFRRLRPDVVFPEVGPGIVVATLPGSPYPIKTDLENLLKHLDGLDEFQRNDAIERTITGTIRELAELTTFGIDPGRLLPVVRSPDFELAQAPAMYPQRLFADCLPILLVLDRPDGLAFVNQDMLDKAGLTADEAFDRAMANLSNHPVRIKWRMPGVFGMLVDGDGHESSHILDEKLWQQIDRDYGREWLVTVMSRDMLVFARNPQSEEALRIAAFAADPPRELDHPISRLAFIRRDGKWTVDESVLLRFKAVDGNKGITVEILGRHD